VALAGREVPVTSWLVTAGFEPDTKVDRNFVGRGPAGTRGRAKPGRGVLAVAWSVVEQAGCESRRGARRRAGRLWLGSVNTLRGQCGGG